MTKIRSGRSSRVVDSRGSSRGGGSLGRSPFGMGGGTGGIPIKAGGGIIGLLVVLAIVFIPQLIGGGGGGGTSAPPAQLESDGGATDCVSEIEQVVCGAVDDVSVYWDTQYPLSFQGQFVDADTVFFSDAVRTGCGDASAQTGPFYCPPDQRVYLDLDFLEQLQREFGASGDLAAQYIVAHEYGHHVQNLTGINDLVRQSQQRDPQVANEFSVALELQADCFAGAWASSVAERDLLDNPQEIDEALNAAAAVGDDRILEQAGRTVDPDLFTHGTSEQRRSWFETGYTTGDPEQCTTFNGSLAPAQR